MMIGERVALLEKRVEELEKSKGRLESLFERKAVELFDAFQKQSDERVARVEAQYAEEVAALKNHIDALEKFASKFDRTLKDSLAVERQERSKDVSAVLERVRNMEETWRRFTAAAFGLK